MGELAAQLRKSQPRKWTQMLSGYELEGDINEDGSLPPDIKLWKISTTEFNRRLVPPPDERLSIIRRIHHRNGHFGVGRTVTLVAQGYWMPQLQKLVSDVVSTCEA